MRAFIKGPVRIETSKVLLGSKRQARICLDISIIINKAQNYTYDLLQNACQLHGDLQYTNHKVRVA